MITSNDDIILIQIRTIKNDTSFKRQTLMSKTKLCWRAESETRHQNQYQFGYLVIKLKNLIKYLHLD